MGDHIRKYHGEDWKRAEVRGRRWLVGLTGQIFKGKLLAGGEGGREGLKLHAHL